MDFNGSRMDYDIRALAVYESTRVAAGWFEMAGGSLPPYRLLGRRGRPGMPNWHPLNGTDEVIKADDCLRWQTDRGDFTDSRGVAANNIALGWGAWAKHWAGVDGQVISVCSWGVLLRRRLLRIPGGMLPRSIAAWNGSRGPK